MEKVTVNLGDKSYGIFIDSDWIASLGGRVREVIDANRILIVSNPTVAGHYGAAALESLRGAGYKAELIEIPEGEENKSVATVERIWDYLIRNGYSRQSALVALGGGVVGDITGFAAASYMRGIEFVQVPTTLLAMVDSSVGGKTGVNHPLAKNIIGAFWQPRLVFVDVACLRTLPVEELRSGFAEVIKHGVIRDAEYFAFLEQNLDKIFGLEREALIHTVEVSCAIKADVVSQDERENGLRAILNFGHTLGHTIEALRHYEGSRHGEAVSIGMVGAAGIAERMGLAASDVTARLRKLIERTGLPVAFPDFPVGQILNRLKSDKKVKNDRIRFVLPTRIGDVVVRDDVPTEIIAGVISK